MTREPEWLPQTAAARRALQVQIARSRRQLERRVGRFFDRSLLFGSVGAYLQEHPAKALLGAAGAGMALSALISRISLPTKIPDWLAELAAKAGWSRLVAQVQAMLAGAAASPGHETATPHG